MKNAVVDIFFVVAFGILCAVLGAKYLAPLQYKTIRYYNNVPITLSSNDKPLPSRPAKPTHDTVVVFDWHRLDSIRNAVGDSVWALALAESYGVEWEHDFPYAHFYARATVRPSLRDAVLDSLYIFPRRDSTIILTPVQVPEAHYSASAWERIKYFCYGAVAVYVYERIR